MFYLTTTEANAKLMYQAQISIPPALKLYLIETPHRSNFVLKLVQLGGLLRIQEFIFNLTMLLTTSM